MFAGRAGVQMSVLSSAGLNLVCSRNATYGQVLRGVFETL